MHMPAIHGAIYICISMYMHIGHDITPIFRPYSCPYNGPHIWLVYEGHIKGAPMCPLNMPHKYCPYIYIYIYVCCGPYICAIDTGHTFRPPTWAR